MDFEIRHDTGTRKRKPRSSTRVIAAEQSLPLRKLLACVRSPIATEPEFGLRCRGVSPGIEDALISLTPQDMYRSLRSINCGGEAVPCSCTSAVAVCGLTKRGLGCRQWRWFARRLFCPNSVPNRLGRFAMNRAPSLVHHGQRSLSQPGDRIVFVGGDKLTVHVQVDSPVGALLLHSIGTILCVWDWRAHRLAGGG